MTLDPRVVIDARDALQKKLDAVCRELNRLRESLGGGRKRQEKIIRLIKQSEKLERGIERLEKCL